MDYLPCSLQHGRDLVGPVAFLVGLAQLPAEHAGPLKAAAGVQLLLPVVLFQPLLVAVVALVAV